MAGGKAVDSRRRPLLWNPNLLSTWLQCLASSDSVYICSTTTSFLFPKKILPPYHRQFQIPAPSFFVKGDHPACGYGISLSAHWEKLPLRTSWPVRGPEKSLLYNHGAIGALGFSQRSADVACCQICFCMSATFLNNAVQLLGA